MIKRIEFSAKNLTSNAGVLPLFNYTKNSGILQYFNERFFESDSLEKVKMNHIEGLLCAGFIGVDRLERFDLMRNDPQYSELGIDIKSPESVSRHLKNYTFKTNQKLRDIGFRVATKLIKKAKLRFAPNGR